MLTDDGDSGLPDGSGVVENSVTVLNSSMRQSGTANSKHSTDAVADITASSSGCGSGVGQSAGTSVIAQLAHEKQAADSTAVITTAALAKQSNTGDAMDIDNAEDRYEHYASLYH
jgi:hypothetical protein